MKIDELCGGIRAGVVDEEEKVRERTLIDHLAVVEVVGESGLGSK